jgi:hypothetical protein
MTAVYLHDSCRVDCNGAEILAYFHNKKKLFTGIQFFQFFCSGDFTKKVRSSGMMRIAAPAL